MIDAGWARQRDVVRITEEDFFNLSLKEAEAINRFAQSTPPGVEVLRQIDPVDYGWTFIFRRPRPCVTTLPKVPE